MLDACHWIADSVKDISPTTVGKCFAKAGFSVDTADSSVNDPEDDLSLAQLMESFKNCAKTPEPITTDDFINIDSGIVTTETGDPDEWKSQILEDLSASSTRAEPVSDNITSDDEQDSLPDDTDISLLEALTLLQILRGFCTQNGLSTSVDALTRVTSDIEAHSVKSKQQARQASIKDFFQ